MAVQASRVAVQEIPERKKLRPYQQQGLDLISRYRSALMAWDMGTGKTLLGVSLMEHIQSTPQTIRGIETPPPRIRALVIAPVNTHGGWANTVQSQMPGTSVYFVGSPDKDPENWGRLLSPFRRSGVYVIGWENMRGWTESIRDAKTNTVVKKVPHIPEWHKARPFNLVIADECHRIQDADALGSRVIRNIQTERKLALSGTAAGNKPWGLWGTLHWLWPGKYRYYWPWVEETMQTRPDPYQKIAIIGEKFPGSATRDIPCYHRLEAKDVLPDLPDVAERIVRVPMLPKQARIYRRFEQEAFAWLDDQPVATPLPIEQQIRLRQVALGTPSAVRGEKVTELTDEDGTVYRHVKEVTEVFFKETSSSNKIDALLDILKDLPEDEPVMVYVHSRRFLRPVLRRLTKYRAVGWSSDTTASQRRRIEKEFGRSWGPRIIVAVIAAIGEGTDGLQHVCANEIWLSQDNNNIYNQQCRARLLRSGQKRMVNRWYIQSEDTIDHKVYERTEKNRIEMEGFYRGADVRGHGHTEEQSELR